jgi:hypothetical protein
MKSKTLYLITLILLTSLTSQAGTEGFSPTDRDAATKKRKSPPIQPSFTSTQSAPSMGYISHYGVALNEGDAIHSIQNPNPNRDYRLAQIHDHLQTIFSHIGYLPVLDLTYSPERIHQSIQNAQKWLSNLTFSSPLDSYLHRLAEINRTESIWEKIEKLDAFIDQVASTFTENQQIQLQLIQNSLNYLIQYLNQQIRINPAITSEDIHECSHLFQTWLSQVTPKTDFVDTLIKVNNILDYRNPIDIVFLLKSTFTPSDSNSTTTSLSESELTAIENLLFSPTEFSEVTFPTTTSSSSSTTELLPNDFGSSPRAPKKSRLNEPSEVLETEVSQGENSQLELGETQDTTEGTPDSNLEAETQLDDRTELNSITNSGTPTLSELLEKTCSRKHSKLNSDHFKVFELSCKFTLGELHRMLKRNNTFIRRADWIKVQNLFEGLKRMKDHRFALLSNPLSRLMEFKPGHFVTFINELNFHFHGKVAVTTKRALSFDTLFQKIVDDSIQYPAKL